MVFYKVNQRLFPSDIHLFCIQKHLEDRRSLCPFYFRLQLMYHPRFESANQRVEPHHPGSVKCLKNCSGCQRSDKEKRVDCPSFTKSTIT